MIEHFAPPGKDTSNTVLTPRQHQIVELLTDGLSYKMIADKLLISVETVRDHIKKIYRTLQVNSKAEVIRKNWMVKSEGSFCLAVCWLAIWLAFAMGDALGQQPSFQHYGIREGLSNRLVRDINFDSRGFVWVATSNGLNRFDGYQFINFTSGENTPPHQRLSQTHVSRVATFEDQRLALFYEDLYSSFDLFDPLTFSVKKLKYR
ncbi:MAG: helix-turn-helix transcriptional regulator [Saprospiraceae bacterium]